MKARVYFFVSTLAVVSLAGSAAAKEQKPSGLALQQIQAKDFEVPKDVTFPSVMSVLQDEGYRINDADLETGLITATASSKTKVSYNLFVGFGTKKKTPMVSAYIENRGKSNSRVRLSFVMAKLKNGILADEEPILDTQVYQDAFEKINQAVFLRVSLDAPAQTPAPTPAATQP